MDDVWIVYFCNLSFSLHSFYFVNSISIPIDVCESISSTFQAHLTDHNNDFQLLLKTLLCRQNVLLLGMMLPNSRTYFWARFWQNLIKVANKSPFITKSQCNISTMESAWLNQDKTSVIHVNRLPLSLSSLLFKYIDLNNNISRENIQSFCEILNLDGIENY